MRILQIWRGETSIREVLRRIDEMLPSQRPVDVIVKRNRRNYQLVAVSALSDALAGGTAKIGEVDRGSRVPRIGGRRRVRRKTHLLGLGEHAIKSSLLTESSGFVPISRKAGILF